MNRILNNLKIIGSFVVAVAMWSSGAQAAEIGPAGCGLGNVFMGKDSQVMASTTNGSSGNQTFGITSGTPNCEEGHRRDAMLNYIDVNSTTLAKDISRGQGESLAGLSKIAGCSDTEAFNAALKSRYQQIYPEAGTSAARVTQAIEQAISEEPTLAKACAPMS